MLKVFGIKNCNSVKKARDFLQNHQIEYEFIDFKKTPPTLDLLKSWEQKAGIEVLINQAGQTYKKLGLKGKNASELLAAALQNPSLIKRPVIVGEGILFFGFDDDFYRENLL